MRVSKKATAHNADYYKNSLFILPLLLVLLIFIVFPAIQIFYGSLYKIKMNGDNVFVGLQNFLSVFNADYIAQVFTNTIIWLALTVLLKNLLGLLLAFVLSKNFMGKKTFSMISLLPWATPWIISAIIFKWIFDGLYGYLNSILFNLQLISKPIDFLGTEAYALMCVIITNVWTAIPFCGFTYLSALYSIPDYLYEAAEIDGASGWQKFKVITLPLIAPTIELLSLLTALWGLNSFDMIYVMTNGGPLYASETLVTNIYRLGFKLNNPGQANALSVVTFMIMTILSLIYIKRGKKGEQYV
jgi:multiple sugar transport system permease protein